MVAPLIIGSGITFEGGISAGPNVTVGPAPGPGGSNGVVSFAEMTATGNVVQWIEGSANATMVTNGFTQTANVGAPGAYNGIAITSLSANNQSFFSTYGTGNKTVTWSSGSTYTSPMTVNLQTNAGNTIVFFMNNVPAFPATFIFPVTFS